MQGEESVLYYCNRESYSAREWTLTCKRLWLWFKVHRWDSKRLDSRMADPLQQNCANLSSATKFLYIWRAKTVVKTVVNEHLEIPFLPPEDRAGQCLQTSHNKWWSPGLCLQYDWTVMGTPWALSPDKDLRTNSRRMRCLTHANSKKSTQSCPSALPDCSARRMFMTYDSSFQ